MARVYEGRAGLAQRVLGPLERLLYRVSGVRPDEDMGWKRYAAAVLLFNVARHPGRLRAPAPAGRRCRSTAPACPAVEPEVAFNTAVSFATNTNWQAYGGETTMSYLTQMLGLTVQNFVSAATGMAVLVALIRGFTRRQAAGVGNFWVDLVALHALRPAAALARARARCSSRRAWCRPSRRRRRCRCSSRRPTADGNAVTHAGDRARAGGLADRDQAARHQRRRLLQRELGPSAREPDAALELPRGARDPADRGGALLHVRRAGAGPPPGLGALRRDVRDLRPAAARVRRRRAGAATRCSTALGVDQAASALQAGGNMEGKEVRFGIANSALWATATTAASNGSVNAMHDSFTPLGGLVPMWLMQLGEVVFGGVGSGLYGMLAFAIVAVFIAGLMVGRTPEYLGKKIEAFEMKMASLVILIPAAVVLVGTAIACVRAGGHGDARQPGRARLQRDPLRVLVRRRQQRLGLRRPHGERPLLRRRDRDRDVRRPLLADRPDPRDRRLARAKKGVPRDGGHAADARAAVRRRCSSAPWCWSARSRSSRRSRSARSSSTCMLFAN